MANDSSREIDVKGPPLSGGHACVFTVSVRVYCQGLLEIFSSFWQTCVHPHPQAQGAPSLPYQTSVELLRSPSAQDASIASTEHRQPREHGAEGLNGHPSDTCARDQKGTSVDAGQDEPQEAERRARGRTPTLRSAVPQTARRSA